MATVSHIVFEHHQKVDKTWNVKIRLGHKSKSKYIDTVHHVTKGQLTKDFVIKDSYIIDRINPILKKYRDAISDMADIARIDVNTLKERLININQQVDVQIDFLDFIRKYIEAKKKEGKTGSARTFLTVANGLQDYFESETVDVGDITAKFLSEYEKFLRSKRVIKRVGNKGTVVTSTKKGVADAGLHNHMRDLRLLFNACRDAFNDEDTGTLIIQHYPFRKYKVGQAPETDKRNISIAKIKEIRDSKPLPGSREELAKDLFMLSFYLCGMNAADLYELKEGLVDRVGYFRKKTRGKRKDKAFISIKLIPEARPLFEKYAGKLQKRYSNCSGLNTAIDKGMPTGVDFYSARHSFGDLARNVCRFSKDDVALAMNHIDRTNRTTDIYISKNWDIIDEVQEGVAALLKEITE